jgi:phosphatidylcholine synthase
MSSFSPLQKALAWATHAFTASGMVAGFFAIVYISQHAFVEAWYCLIAALIIDGVDGTFARLFKVREVLPKVNGQMMDYVVDFANYAIIPGYFIYEAGEMVNGKWEYILPEEWRWAAIAMLLIVSVLYYGMEGMVSTDMYFVGFPVMWNAVAFYLFFIFDWAPWVNFGWIVFLSIAHFLPLKFIYPSRSTKFLIPNIIGTVVIIGSNLGLLAAIALDGPQEWLRIGSIAGMVYFWGLSLYHTFLDPDTRGIK